MDMVAFLPSPALAGFVACYGLWEGEAPADAPVLHQVLPGVVNGLNVLYDDPETPTLREQLAESARPVEVVGLVTWQQLHLSQPGRVGLLGIYFRPAGFFHLFGVPLTEATTATPEPRGAAVAFARELVRRLREATTQTERLAVANELLLRQIGQLHPTPDVIDVVADRILHQHGQVSIEVLAHEVGLSRRQLERRFLLEVGASPKLYARLVRFHHAIRLVAESPVPNWQDIAYSCGYYDQAHFIREFRRFTGQTPGAYSLQNSSFEKLFLTR